MEKARPDGFCLVCSKADLNSNDFGCNEPNGLCGTCNHLILYNFNIFIFYLISLFYQYTAKRRRRFFKSISWREWWVHTETPANAENQLIWNIDNTCLNTFVSTWTSLGIFKTENYCLQNIFQIGTNVMRFCVCIREYSNIVLLDTLMKELILR